jgi:asparagine synthase (glutamine-hydrolysing)
MSQFLVVLGGPSESPLRYDRGDLERVLSGWPGQQSTEEAPGAAMTMKMVAPDEQRRTDRQPLVDSSRQLAVVADCRLDNRTDLQRALGLESSTTNAEVLLRGYQCWGDDLPGRLRGDFSGVIWDWRNQRCLLFRDPLGIKPLFFKRDAAHLLVASDVELIGDLVGYGPVDAQKVVEHLLWRYASVERTFWETIQRLPGGHLLCGAPGALAQRRYWRPAISPVRTQPEAMEILAAQFKRSVERRMSGPEAIFAHLSGGLDSSSIVCAAAQIAQQRTLVPRITTVSQRFPGSPTDEEPFIRAVVEWTDVVGVEWDEPAPSLGDVQNPSLAGPGIDSHRTSGSAGDLDIVERSGGHILLAGTGGDQFGAAAQVADDMIERNPIEFFVQTLWPSSLTRPQRLLRARLMLRSMVPRVVRREVGVRRFQGNLPRWLQASQRRLAGDLLRKSYEDAEVDFPDAIRRGRWKDLNSGGLGMSLDVNHRAAARRGVEFRYPFLDQELVEAMLSIPTEFWPRPTMNARLHRRPLSGILPPIVAERRTKAEFAEQLARRLRQNQAMVQRLFDDGDWMSGPYVDRLEAQSLLRHTFAGTAQPGEALTWRGVWNIATLEAWLRRVSGYTHRSEGQTYG